MTLSDTDRAILDFERGWWKAKGRKEAAILELFGLSGVRYYQVLVRLMDDPDAYAYDAMLIKRLRRLRVERQRARNPERVGL